MMCIIIHNFCDMLEYGAVNIISNLLSIPQIEKENFQNANFEKGKHLEPLL